MMIDTGFGDDKNHHDWLRCDLLCHLCLSGHCHRCLLLPLQWIPSWSQPCQSSIWIDIWIFVYKEIFGSWYFDAYLRDVCKLISNIAISFLTSQYSPSMATLSIPIMDRYVSDMKLDTNTHLLYGWYFLENWPSMGKYDPHICDDATAGDNSLLRARKTHFLSGDCFVPGGKILNLVVLSSSCIVLQFCLKSKSPYILISPAVLCRVWLIWRRGKLVDWPQICLPPHFTSTASDCLIGLDLFPSLSSHFSLFLTIKFWQHSLWCYDTLGFLTMSAVVHQLCVDNQLTHIPVLTHTMWNVFVVGEWQVSLRWSQDRLAFSSLAPQSNWNWKLCGQNVSSQVSPLRIDPSKDYGVKKCNLMNL